MKCFIREQLTSSDFLPVVMVRTWCHKVFNTKTILFTLQNVLKSFVPTKQWEIQLNFLILQHLAGTSPQLIYCFKCILNQ